MGWYYNWDTRKELIDHLTQQHSETQRTLRHCTRDNILWALHLCTISGEPKRLVGCYLLNKDHSDGWGYKPMDETMGPFYYNCPKTYIRDASPPINQTAADWRAKVLEYHKKAKR